MTIIDPTLMGLVPTSGLLWWHRYDPSTSADGVLNDVSGNGRNLTQATTPPVLTLEQRNGRPGWYFNGSSNPLTSTTFSSTAKHIFVYASADEATFAVNRGLVSGKTSGNWLTTDNTSTSKFFTFSATDYTYRKSDSLYAAYNWQSPVSGVPELIEMTYPTGLSMDGIQYGQQLATSNKWKGYFYEAMAFDRVLTTNERRRVMLFFNVVYQADTQGVPLYAPTADLLTGTRIIAPTRFRAVPPDWEKITQSWEYEDGNEDKNEVASTAPRTWEYGLKIAEISPGQAEAYKAIFDGFNDTARRSKKFYFRDKFGNVWSDVRILNYDNNHDAHKSWAFDINFVFKTNTGVVITAADVNGSYIIDGGLG